jgi:superfamily II DNA helicase RecQ
MFPDVPLMALTASATPLYVSVVLLAEMRLTFLLCRVQDDIVRTLRMAPDRLLKFVHPFNRPNLFYEVCCVVRNDIL